MKAKTTFLTSKASVSHGVMIGMVAALSIMVATNTTNSQRKTAASAKKPSALNAEEIARKILPSVVLIVCEDGRGNTSIGSGFFVATGRPQQFMIATAYHVIKGMVRGTWRTPNDRKAAGKSWAIGAVLNYDEQSDVALLQPETDPYVYIELVRAGFGSRIRPLTPAIVPPRPGQTIYALGSPEGLTGTISQGIVSAAPRHFKGGTRIQVSAPISPGSSGGPVVNSAGEVVGIAESFLDEGQNLNFAVPVSLLSQLLKRTPSVPRFDDWERARSQRNSEEDWLWIPERAGLSRDEESGIGSGRELATEWQLVASGRGNGFYISRARITPTPERTFICWIKTVPDDTPEGRASQKRYVAELNEANVNRSYAFSYTMDQDEFDCGHQRGRTLTSAYYDQAGVLLYNRDSSTRSAWIPVLPDSVYEELLNFVCKGRQ